MTEDNVDIWAHYCSPSETSLVERLRNTGPMQDSNGTWVGRFANYRDAHEAADKIEHLERQLAQYEETIRYLTLQLGKTL